jgi:signal transduction histidine kinase/ligand-binding sensor domain-containing protein
VSRIILLYFLLLLSFAKSANCQQLSVFQTLTVKDGLPSNYVFDACEDENGFLWIGTDKGLAKYDGFTWQIINTDNGLPGNYITFAQCDSNGGIWLSIGGKGIYYYNINTKKITAISTSTNQGECSMNKEGEILIQKYGSNNIFSLCAYAAKNNFKEKVIYEMSYTSCNTRKLNMDINNKTIVQFAAIGNFTLANGWKMIKQYNDEKHLLWNSNTDSVFHLDGNIIIHKKNNVFRKQIFSKKGYFFSTNNNNQFYFWNIHDGFWQIDLNENSKHYTEDDGLASNLVNKILVTKKKQVFVCTLGGGLQMQLPERNVKISTNQQQARTITMYKNMAYICTENKLFVVDAAISKLMASYPLQESAIESIAVSENNIIIATLTGLSFYSIKNNQLQKINSIKQGAGISTVFEKGDNYLYSTYGSGIFSLTKAKQATILRKEAQYAIIEKLQETTSGYAGLTYEDGVHFFDKNMQPQKTFTIKDGLPSNEIYDVHQYKDSTWISTAKGVSILVKNTVAKNINFNNASIKDKCIYSFHSKDGKYWVVTNKGLYAYNNKKLSAVGTYALINNASENVKTVLFDTATNTLIAGANEAITLYNMGAVKRDESVTAPSLLFAQADNDTKNLGNNFTLPFNFNKISFSIVPGVSNPFLQPTIQYKLEGLNESFQPLKDSTIIHFEKLRPGNYTLIAKALNVDEYESKEIILAQFEIKKPYWQETWFAVLSILAIVVVSILSFNYFQRKKQLQKDKANQLALSVSKERERISKDLHDHLGTSLVTMIAQTDNIENKLINNNVEDALLKVQQLSDQSRESMNVLRETIWAVQENSHTLTEFTLRVRTFLQRVMDAHEMSWALVCNGTLSNNLSAEQTLHLFRMIQEVTQNIIKHAASKHAQYTIDANESKLKITITDDGKGFDTNAIYTSNGLKNLAARIKELDGTINITSALQKGTTIIVQLSI